MNRLGRIVLQASAYSILALLAAPAMAGAPFFLDVQQTYANVDVGQTMTQLVFDLRTPYSSPDSVDIHFDTYMPNEYWSAQFRDSRTGIVYFGDATIALPPNNVPDEIQVDFSEYPGDDAKAWVDFHISRHGDPSTYREVSLAVGHGVTLPVPRFLFNANPAFKRGNLGDTIAFPGVIRSYNSFDDSLKVTYIENVPTTWFVQYCQNSTGTCYFTPRTVPFRAGILDTLTVDFITDSTAAVGHYRMKVQSTSNPAFWQAIPYGAMTGNVVSSVDNGSPLGQFAVRAAPNPLRTQTDFMISLANPSTVRLLVVDVSGRQVLSRMASLPSAGWNRIRWDARDATGRPLPTGTYFYRVGNGKDEARGKVIITQ